ncbi:MAG: hypothetical protein EOP32_19170 [Rhodococcus sp. (in: high G+C Gram-positive bacteria)]|nr:MAG: hypothetical protein EOP32_19170 [Rhodococcus sp. (in: high G+C Gram-positive bacteria)]
MVNIRQLRRLSGVAGWLLHVEAGVVEFGDLGVESASERVVPTRFARSYEGIEIVSGMAIPAGELLIVGFGVVAVDDVCEKLEDRFVEVLRDEAVTCPSRVRRRGRAVHTAVERTGRRVR